MCRRRHDRGGVDIAVPWPRPLFQPVNWPTVYWIDLARQPRNFVLALAVRAMTGGASGNVGFGKPFLVDSLTRQRWIPSARRRMVCGLRSLKCVASAVIIDGLSTCATLRMIGLVRLRSMKARN